jgi:hypothetical protein
MTELERILEATTKLNEYLYDELKLENSLFSVTIYGYITSISFNIEDIEIPIWNSENDDRLFFENSNEYEPFERFIKRVWKEKLKIINKIKF